mmetsp:Transcript_35860/g.113385  ORF Transcript_35860/g.113385 Transcript_35860/m.113385 type:complete len:301 (+) Transcript_35860:373-1275(+)
MRGGGILLVFGDSEVVRGNHGLHKGGHLDSAQATVKEICRADGARAVGDDGNVGGIHEVERVGNVCDIVFARLLPDECLVRLGDDIALAVRRALNELPLHKLRTRPAVQDLGGLRALDANLLVGVIWAVVCQVAIRHEPGAVLVDHHADDPMLVGQLLALAHLKGRDALGVGDDHDTGPAPRGHAAPDLLVGVQRLRVAGEGDVVVHRHGRRSARDVREVRGGVGHRGDVPLGSVPLRPEEGRELIPRRRGVVPPGDERQQVDRVVLHGVFIQNGRVIHKPQVAEHAIDHQAVAAAVHDP